MTMTTNETAAGGSRSTGANPEPHSVTGRARRGPVIASALVILALLAAAVLMVVLSDDSTEAEAETVAVRGQGGVGDMLASDGARLIRRADGLFAELDVPIPEAGTYEYPTADILPPWAAPHPPVSPGASDAPEVFTLWLITFNDGSLCTDARCDADDLGLDVAAKGGAYQLDGRVADGERLRFAGNIRLGQEPSFGAPLENVSQAEVHLLIAPHGRVLSGTDGWRQLNGPVGNPTFWWAAEFPAT